MKLLLLGRRWDWPRRLSRFVAGRQILTFFYTPEYARHLDVFVLYLAAGGVGYVGSFLGYGITAARYFKVQVLSLATLTGITALTCAWLIPAYGLRGAAWSALLIALAQIAVNLLILRRALKALPAPAPLDLMLPAGTVEMSR